MSKKKLTAMALIVSGASILLGLVVVSFLSNSRPRSGLKVDTTPPSVVFVDNLQIGRTPIETSFKSGNLDVRIKPESATSAAIPEFSTTIRLVDGTYSVIKYDFSASESATSGEAIGFQSIPGSLSHLAVVTTYPDSASVVLNGKPQGSTPILITNLTPGEHRLILSSPGFVSRTVGFNVLPGIRADVRIRLASSSPPQTVLFNPNPTPSVTSPVTPTPDLASARIQILDTPTGFLRVRSKPDKNSPEIGRVSPGETYTHLDTSAGWYQIKLDLAATGSGWVSSQHAQKI